MPPTCRLSPHRPPRTWTLTCGDESLEEAFARINTSGTGKLSYDEVSHVVVRRDNGQQIAERELDALFMKFDLNGDGEISKSEFTRMWEVDERRRDNIVGQSLGAAAAAAAAPASAAPRPVAATSPDEAPPTTATLAEQIAALQSQVAAREHCLRAVWSNIDASMRSLVDTLVEEHLGLRLRARAGQLNYRGSGEKTSVAPCSPLMDAPLMAGFYNGTIVLFFVDDVPQDICSNVEATMSKLLDLKSKTGRRVVHHVLALPCGGVLDGGAFFASGRESRSTALRKHWRATGHPDCHAMSEHLHLRPLLEPLMQAVARAALPSEARSTVTVA